MYFSQKYIWGVGHIAGTIFGVIIITSILSANSVPDMLQNADHTLSSMSQRSPCENITITWICVDGKTDS